MTTGQPSQSPSNYAHIQVAKVAKGIAEAIYEEAMRDNDVFAQHKRICPELTRELQRKLFIRLLLPHCLERARATLAGMLARDYPESLKSAIHDALIKDQGLRAYRNRSDRRKALSQTQ